METQKTWFIVGASRGLGFEIARAALDAGDKLVGRVRNKRFALYAELENHPKLFVSYNALAASGIKLIIQLGQKLK